MTDGQTSRFNIVDMVSQEITTEALDFIPKRITVAPNGLTAALADPATGRLSLVDLLRRQSLGSTTGPAPLHDLLFSADGRTLYLSGGTSSTIAVIDAETGRQGQSLDTGLPPGTLALTRSPNGGGYLFSRVAARLASSIWSTADLWHRSGRGPLRPSRFPLRQERSC